MFKGCRTILALTVAVLPVLPAGASPTSAQLADAAAAEKRGEEMFAYDQAAWRATDRFQEDIRRRGERVDVLHAQGLRGYIVEPGDAGALLATFYGEQNGRRFVVARYSVIGSTVTGGGFVDGDGPRDLSLLARRMIDAREQAIDAMQKPEHGLCTSSSPNTMVLPPRSDGLVSVYILSSTTDGDMYPAGGHFRFDFDANGKLIGERRFMKTCFNLSFAPRDGKRPTGLVLSHLLDPQPTEIHAFVSRNIPVPLMIATMSSQAIWNVADGRIRFLRDIVDKK